MKEKSKPVISRDETFGTGITAVKERMYSVEGDTSPVADSFKRWNKLLESKGGQWGAITSGVREACEWLLDEKNDVGIDHDDQRVFAKKILKWLNVVDLDINEGGEDQRIARFAFEAGVEWATLSMKINWERAALRGVKNLKATKKGAIARNNGIEKTKEDVREWWLRWQSEPSMYKNKTAYDVTMSDKTGVGIPTIAKWRKQFEKDNLPSKD